MRTVCNFEVSMTALVGQVAALSGLLADGKIHPVPHTAQLVAAAGATFVGAMKQLLGEHRKIAHEEGGDEHEHAVFDAAKLLGANLDSAQEAFFHDDSPSEDDAGGVPPFTINDGD